MLSLRTFYGVIIVIITILQNTSRCNITIETIHNNVDNVSSTDISAINDTSGAEFNCSTHIIDISTCNMSTQCVINTIYPPNHNISQNCSIYSNSQICMADKKCYWFCDTCISIWDCSSMDIESCSVISGVWNTCFWSNKTEQCLPNFNYCEKNNKDGCLKTKHCQWNGTRCNLVSDYGMECSNTINDVGYTGTVNVTCDGTPCLYWEDVYRSAPNQPITSDIYFEQEGLTKVNNYCRASSSIGATPSFMGAWCFVLSNKFNTTVISKKPCCVPVCMDKFDTRTKCKFTNRGRYEYSGNLNVSCSRNQCRAFPNLIELVYQGFVERITTSDFPIDILEDHSLGSCSYNEIQGQYIENNSILCFDLNTCRNPNLQNEGDFCFADTVYEGEKIEQWVTKQPCCIAKCEDADQVTCKWSASGKEYSGRISMTEHGHKCVNWSRSLHNNELFVQYHDFTSIHVYRHDILSLFPDHSFDEAANYCRNPTRDPCGPWCYTSYADNSTGYCNIPECNAANKGGQTDSKAHCLSEIIIDIQFYLTHLIQPLLFLIGVILNLFSFNVFQQKDLKDSTTSYMFKILAVFDTLALVLGPGQDIIINRFGIKGIENIHNAICKVYWPIRYFSWSYPGWILVFITLERCICISKPFDAATIYSKKNILKWLVITGVILIIIYCPNMLYKTKWIGAEKSDNQWLNRSSTYRYDDEGVRYKEVVDVKYTKTEGECVSLPVDYWTNIIMTSMVYVDFVVAAQLPFTIMIVCNVIIIFNLVSNRKKQKTIKASGSGPDLVNLTTTLVLVSFSYIILTSPSTLLVVGWNYFGITSGHSHSGVKLCRNFAKILLNMNNSLNFIQYVCTGKKFQAASLNLIGIIVSSIKRLCLRFNPIIWPRIIKCQTNPSKQDATTENNAL